jgi:hypothetical protein
MHHPDKHWMESCVSFKCIKSFINFVSSNFSELGGADILDRSQVGNTE